MRKRILSIFSLVLMFLFFFDVPAQAAEITFYHTNDLHARVEAGDDNGKSAGLAEIAAVVKEGKKHKTALWFDSGDLIHGMPRVNITKGEVMVPLLNEAGLDLMVPGNHDFNFGFAQLKNLSEKFRFPVLSANIAMKEVPEGQAEKVLAFRPYTIFSMENGIKVGVFGLTTPETRYKTDPKNVTELEFLDPVACARAMVSMLRHSCDVVVAVMHMGVDEGSEITSETIARAVPGIDVIIDGHSHTKLPNGEWVNQTLIVQTGWHGHCLGEVTVQVDDHKVVSKKARLIEPDEMEKIAPVPDKAVIKILKKLKAESDSLMNEIVSYSDHELSADRDIVRTRESELGDFYADAIGAAAGTDIAVINGGALRANLPRGNVTRENLMEVTPFGNTLKAIRVKGSTIRKIVEYSVSKLPSKFGGFLDFSGLTFSFDPSRPVGERVSDILVGGEQLEPEKDYTVAALDYLCNGGDDYSMLVGAPVVGEFDTVESVVADYMNSGAEVGADMGRITVLGKEVATDSKEAA